MAAACLDGERPGPAADGSSRDADECVVDSVEGEVGCGLLGDIFGTSAVGEVSVDWVPASLPELFGFLNKEEPINNVQDVVVI